MSVQQFSIFHETDPARLQQWHRPYASLFKAGAKVLDVGCGPGYFADVLRERNVECVGVDIDPAMVEMARLRGHVAELGTQDSLTKWKESFDGVHVSHVVEHLWGDDLVALLTNATATLKPHGLIVIRTPNWENRYVRETLFWMDHTHKRPYPRELLNRMLSDLGMMEIDSGAEPFGMNDTYVVAAKSVDKPQQTKKVQFDLQSIPTPGRVSRMKSYIRLRMLRFLGLS